LDPTDVDNDIYYLTEPRGYPSLPPTFVGEVYAVVHGEAEHGHDETQQREKHPVLAELGERMAPHDFQRRADFPAVPAELLVGVAVHDGRRYALRAFDVVAQFFRVTSVHLRHDKKKTPCYGSTQESAAPIERVKQRAKSTRTLLKRTPVAN